MMIGGNVQKTPQILTKMCERPHSRVACHSFRLRCDKFV